MKVDFTLIGKLPKKYFKDPQYWYKKTRNGKENTFPFQLEKCGKYVVQVNDKNKINEYYLKVWYNPFGIAFQFYDLDKYEE